MSALTDELCETACIFEHLRSRGSARQQPYPATLRATLRLEEVARARRVLEGVPTYSPTPLYSLSGLAAALGIRQLTIKDESTRLGLRAFKGVGGLYAVYRVLMDRAESLDLPEASVSDFLSGTYRSVAQGVTVASATTGNHGRSVAFAAKLFGCRCVIYVPRATSRGRVDALEALGANVVRIDGSYDAAVERVEEDAAKENWIVVADTARPGHDYTALAIMHGYRVIADEVVRQYAGTELPTHVFVQTGVGGIAAAFCSHFWEVWGALRPRFIVVESRHAACMLESAKAGRTVIVDDASNTRLPGLAAGKPSSVAWEILRVGADDFVSIDDAAAFFAMRVLAFPRDGDSPIVAGEAGAAGLGALIVALSKGDRGAALGLSESSRVLLVATEGATDPMTYVEIVGKTMEQVLAGQERAIGQ